MDANTFHDPYDRVEEENTYGEPYSPTLRIILSQFRECKPFWDEIYETARRDKQFVQSKQWDLDVEKERNKYGLATVTIPLISNFFNKQLGNALPGSISYRLTNTDPKPNAKEKNQETEASIKVLNGHLRYIDKNSNSEIHRNKARKDQFSGGIGWLGLDYVTSESLVDGEIQDMSPRHFDKVYAHPYYQKADASDMEYSFYFIDMPYEVAIGKFGNRIKRIKERGEAYYTFDNYDDCRSKISTLDDAKHIKSEFWMNDKEKSVRIAIHHWRKKTERTFYTYNEKEYTEEQFSKLKADLKELGETKMEGVKKEVKKGWYVEQRTICGWTVLEKKDFFINRIPWTPVLGYTMEDGEKYTYHGIIHDGVNLQEHANWLFSQHATKTSQSKTMALIDGGVLNEGAKTQKINGVNFLAVDMSADMSSNGQPAQIIADPDDGTKELANLQFTIELLREITSISSDVDQAQVINSAQQLALKISDRDSIREELDINWRMALEIHTSKKIDMIKAVNNAEDLLKVIHLDKETERIGKEQLLDSINYNYAVDIKLAPSGTVQKQQAQQFANNMIASPDPVKQTMGLLMSVDNSELQNKDEILKTIHKQSFAQGDISNIPPDLLQEIIEEQNANGQIQQTLQRLAEPIAQQRVQEMLQDKNIQAQLANAEAIIGKSQGDVQKAQYNVQKAQTETERAIVTSELDLLQEQEQTAQDFFELQKRIVEAEIEGVQIDRELAQQFLQLATQLQPQQLIQ